MKHNTPWRIRFHLWLSGWGLGGPPRYLPHYLTHYNDAITIPLRDPSAKGILAECSCGKKWVL